MGDIIRRTDFWGVNGSQALSRSDRKGMARDFAIDDRVWSHQNGRNRRKMFAVAEGTVMAISYVGVIVRAGDAEIAMNPAAAPYVQQIVGVGSMGLAHIVADMAR